MFVAAQTETIKTEAAQEVRSRKGHSTRSLQHKRPRVSPKENNSRYNYHSHAVLSYRKMSQYVSTQEPKITLRRFTNIHLHMLGVTPACTSQFHEQRCSCHEQRCSCHEQRCSCHEQRCSCHEQRCSCSKITLSSKSERGTAL